MIKFLIQSTDCNGSVDIVYQVGDGIACIYGLERAMSGELLEFEDGSLRIALNLEASNIGAVLLSIR